MERLLGTDKVKRGMAEMQKGGVIMDVVNAEQARIAEQAGAVAVMALERVPSDIRAAGGVARMADPTIVEEVMNAVSIPVMAKARIGHIVEARIFLTYGGVSLFIVGFSVFPLALSLFKQANLPRRFIPAALAFGSKTAPS